MPRILVISDTHLFGETLPKTVDALLGEVDALVHCGDFTHIGLLENLSDRGLPLYGVLGNCDKEDWSLQYRLPRRLIFDFEEVTIGVVHGDGSLIHALHTAQREFQSNTLDLVFFGHSHIPYQGKHGGTWFFNPGSLTSGRGGSNTYGIVEIKGKEISFTLEEF